MVLSMRASSNSTLATPVSAGQLPRRGEKLPEATAKKHVEADTRRVGGNRNRVFDRESRKPFGT
jgi:hypothetical protein